MMDYDSSGDEMECFVCGASCFEESQMQNISTDEELKVRLECLLGQRMILLQSILGSLLCKMCLKVLEKVKTLQLHLQKLFNATLVKHTNASFGNEEFLFCHCGAKDHSNSGRDNYRWGSTSPHDIDNQVNVTAETRCDNDVLSDSTGDNLLVQRNVESGREQTFLNVTVIDDEFRRTKSKAILSTGCTCNICGVTFLNKKEIKVHIEQVHDGSTVYACSLCGSVFETQEHMTAHQEDRTPIPCEFCGKMLFGKDGYVYHMRSHGADRRYSCIYCPRAFIRKSDRAGHLLTHTGERPYQCSTCGQKFRGKSVLKCHMLRHSGLKPFKCNDCSKTFRKKYHLDVHRRIHTGERPYKCGLCGKGFIDSGNRDAHMRTHSGRRRFECSTCGQGFHQRNKYAEHLATHDGDDVDIMNYLSADLETCVENTVEIVEISESALDTSESAVLPEVETIWFDPGIMPKAEPSDSYERVL